MKTRRVSIVPVSLRHQQMFVSAVRRSRDLYRPWGGPPSTPERFRALVKQAQGDTHRVFLVFNVARDLVGVVTISQIVRGVFRSAYLSYHAFAPHNGQGYMSAGLRAVIRRAFTTLRLHRLEANVQPANRRSIELVKRAGFRLEGLSPRYLKIRGRWQDHERWALIREDWSKNASSRGLFRLQSGP